jgi:hypothetical protein
MHDDGHGAHATQCAARGHPESRSQEARPLAGADRPWAIVGKRSLARSRGPTRLTSPEAAPSASQLRRSAVAGRAGPRVAATSPIRPDQRRAPLPLARRPRASCRQQPFQLLLRPDRLQCVAVCLVPLDDRAPCLDRLGQPSFPLEQEGAHVQTADALRVELQRALPVGERALPVTEAGLRLTSQFDQRRVVGREPESSLNDLKRRS